MAALADLVKEIAKLEGEVDRLKAEMAAETQSHAFQLSVTQARIVERDRARNERDSAEAKLELAAKALHFANPYMRMESSPKICSEWDRLLRAARGK